MVGSTLTGSTVTTSDTTSTTTMRLAEAAAEEQTVKQRKHTAKDRTIRSGRFPVPDLESPRIKAAAARAGVDLNNQASIDEADRRYDALQNPAPAGG